MITVTEIQYNQSGTQLTYDFQIDGEHSKLFSGTPLFVNYDVDVRSVPYSISIIPFLVNVLPIAWFAGFDVKVKQVDAAFLASLNGLRAEWTKHYPFIASKKSQLIYDEVITNDLVGEKSAMLFSGGVDAFATFFRKYNEKPDLITIQGADIELTDTKQWEDVKRFNESEPILKENSKHYIQTNFRDFYTHKVDYLLPNLGWWGHVQHGMALMGITAPLTFVEKYHTLYIASTRSSHMEFNAWGSMPEIDNQMRWANLVGVHDAFELKRQDKVDQIVYAVQKLQAKTTIRVCYSELKDELNCSKCEKCIRTIFGIMLSGDNPNNYGFDVDEKIYDSIRQKLSKGFKSRGNQFFWEEILQKEKESTSVYVFSDAKKEAETRAQVMEFIQNAVHQPIVKTSSIKKIKHALIHNNPKMFELYMKIRRKF